MAPGLFEVETNQYNFVIAVRLRHMPCIHKADRQQPDAVAEGVGAMRTSGWGWPTKICHTTTRRKETRYAHQWLGLSPTW